MQQRFSDRVGITTPRTTLQVDTMTSELRNSLWNAIAEAFDQEGQDWARLARLLGGRHYRLPVDRIPEHEGRARDWVRVRFFEAEWWDRYNIAQFVVDNSRELTLDALPPGRLAERLNVVLERELAGYRFVDGQLVPITAEAEVEAVEDALAQSRSEALTGMRAHLHEALQRLGTRPTPDHRGAIKTAMRAVASAAQAIAGKEQATVDDALQAVATTGPLHAAMVAASRALFGHTSHEDGIRHALVDESARVDAEDARFFVVACASFVNLLIVKADKAGRLTLR